MLTKAKGMYGDAINLILLLSQSVLISKVSKYHRDTIELIFTEVAVMDSVIDLIIKQSG